MGVYSDALFYIFIYLPLYFLFTFIQRLYWLCSGKSDIISQVEAGQLYERSAQVFDIRYKLKKEPFQLLGRQNFIATHRAFEHPNCVLAHNISLLTVELDKAIFVQVPDNYDVFDCRKSPFIHLGQFSESIRMITMPISSLFRCADELGDPKMKVIWLHSTGRCGSTAMSQVFEAVPNCTTISEPMSLIVARTEASLKYNSKQYRKWLTSPWFTKFVRSTTRMMAKPNEHNPDILFIKNCTMAGAFEVPEIEKYFPDHVHLFLYRDCLETVQSYIRSLNRHFLLRIVMRLRSNALLRYIIRTPKILIQNLATLDTLDQNPWLLDETSHLSMTCFGLMVIQWGSFCQYYSHLATNGKSRIRAIRYEDIVNQKHATLTMLFKFCGISVDHVELAKKGLEKDSQEGTVLSKSNLGKFKKMHVTAELRAEGNRYLKSFKLEKLGEPTYLPSVLSPLLPHSPSSKNMTIDTSTMLCKGISDGQVAITIHA